MSVALETQNTSVSPQMERGGQDEGPTVFEETPKALLSSGDTDGTARSATIVIRSSGATSPTMTTSPSSNNSLWGDGENRCSFESARRHSVPDETGVSPLLVTDTATLHAIQGNDNDTTPLYSPASSLEELSPSPALPPPALCAKNLETLVDASGQPELVSQRVVAIGPRNESPPLSAPQSASTRPSFMPSNVSRITINDDDDFGMTLEEVMATAPQVSTSLDKIGVLSSGPSAVFESGSSMQIASPTTCDRTATDGIGLRSDSCGSRGSEGSVSYDDNDEDNSEAVHGLGNTFDDRLLKLFMEEQKTADGLDRPCGELLEALEKRVAEVMVDFEAGQTYSNNPIDEAIVARRCAKTVEPSTLGFRTVVALNPEPLPAPIAAGPSYGGFFSEDDEDDDYRDQLDEYDEEFQQLDAARRITPTNSPTGHQVQLPTFAPLQVSTLNNQNAQLERSAIVAGGSGRGGVKNIAHRVRLLRFFTTLLVWYYLAAMAFVAFVLLIYYLGPLRVCNIHCSCSAGEGFSYIVSYGLLLHLPRCFFMSLLCEVMVHAKEETPGRPQRAAWDILPVIEILKTRKNVWALATSSAVFYLLLVGPSSALDLPDYVFKPIVVVALVLPFLLYTVGKQSVAVGGVITIVHLIPTVYLIVAPNYNLLAEKKAGLWTLWPLIVLIVERAVVYLIHFLLPVNRTPFAAKLILAHVATLYGQCLLAATLVSLDAEEHPAVVTIFVILWITMEAILSTTLIECFLLKIQQVFRQYVMRDKWQHMPRPPTDFISVMKQTRCLTGWFAIVGLLPSLAFARFPDAITSTCDGVGDIETRHWISYLLACFVVTTAFIITGLQRWIRNKLRLPLGLLSPQWALAVSLYFATMTIKASSAMISGTLI